MEWKADLVPRPDPLEGSAQASEASLSKPAFVEVKASDDGGRGPVEKGQMRESSQRRHFWTFLNAI